MSLRHRERQIFKRLVMSNHTVVAISFDRILSPEYSLTELFIQFPILPTLQMRCQYSNQVLFTQDTELHVSWVYIKQKSA